MNRRALTETAYVVASVLAIIFVVNFLYNAGLRYYERATAEPSTLEQVQAGDIILRCHSPEGSTNISPSLVVDYQQGAWVITGIEAPACDLIVISTTTNQE